jgi:hypothetical protein
MSVSNRGTPHFSPAASLIHANQAFRWLYQVPFRLEENKSNWGQTHPEGKKKVSRMS